MPTRTQSAMLACLITLGANGLNGCASHAPLAQQAVVGTEGKVDVIVDASVRGAKSEKGLPVFHSIQAALDAAPATQPPGQQFRILIRPGRYYEKLLVKKPGIALIGIDRDATVLSYDAVAGALSPDGRVWGTSGSGTLIIRATDFSAENLTVENSFDYAANRRKREGDPTRYANPQAVAVMTDNGADRSLFRNVRIVGEQDSLYVEAGRSYFYKSVVAGHVDFILGAGQAVFEDCDIVTRYRPSANPIGWITAASTQIRDHHGMLFIRSRLLRESPAVPAESTFLGRPWHPTVNFADGRYADPNAIASVVFVDCWMDEHIRAQGWDEMGGFLREGGRKMFSPNDARFFEHRSSGPGAHVTSDRPQLTDQQAAQLSPRSVLGDWIPVGAIQLATP